MPEDIIKAADILHDVNRLPFIGYTLEITHDATDKRLLGKVKLATKGQPEHMLTVFDLAVNAKSVTEIERMVPVIEAALDYINVGGDRIALMILIDDVIQALPEISLKGFELMSVSEEKCREVYYRDALQNIVRVIPDEFAEVISEQEFNDLHVVTEDDEPTADDGSEI